MEEFRLHAKLNQHKTLIKKTESVIADALCKPFDWSVAFSGGKDSTVVLDMVFRQNQSLPVVWFDDGWDYPETLQFLSDTEKRLNKKIFVIHQPVTSGFNGPDMVYRSHDPATEHKCDLTFNEWKKVKNKGSFVGLRKEESAIRRMVLSTRGHFSYRKDWRDMACYPLANWTYRDIWAYIISRDIPYNPVYDKLAELGVPIERRRVGPLTAFMVYQYGFLVTVKRGWPELFNRFASIHPEARFYV